MAIPQHQPPTNAQLGRFFKNVKMIGGARVPDICRSEELGYAIHGSDRVTIVPSCACGAGTLVDLPYRAESGQMRGARVCADCDCATHMPRVAA